jgi:hypothetical protein
MGEIPGDVKRKDSMGDDINRCIGQVRGLYDPPLVNPDNSYEIEDFVVPSTIRPQVGYIPSTLFVDLSIQGCNLTTGKNGRLGVRLSNPTSITVGQGALSAGLPVLPDIGAPWIGLGNIYYIPGEGAALGWFSTSSSPNPYVMLFAGGLVLLQTVINGECDGAGRCSLNFTSNLLQSALPINTLRELIQKLGAKTQEDACDTIWNHNKMAGCMAYSASYQKQGLYQAARDMVSHGLKDEDDPFTRAQLMAMRDDILFAENAGGLFAFLGLFSDLTPMTRKIADNIKTAATSVNSFLDENEAWLLDSGKRPKEKDFREFMANTLYLFRKLQISGHVGEKKFEITSSAPIAFRNGGDAVYFMQTVARAHKTLSRAKGLWVRIMLEKDAYADFITGDGLERHDADSVISSFFRLDNLFNWTREVTTFNLPLLFEARKAHIIWMLNESGGKEKASKIDALRSVELGDVQAMIDVSAAELAGAFADDLAEVVTVKEYDGLYFGLEYIFRLNQSDDPLTEAHGLDLTGIINEPSLGEAFYHLFQFTVKERNGQTRGIEGLGRHIREQLQGLAKKRRGGITGELDEYGGEFASKRDTAFESVLDIHRAVTELEDMGKDVPGATEQIRGVKNSCIEAAEFVRNVRQKGFEDISGIIEATEGDERRFFELMGRIGRQTETLADTIYAADKDEAAVKGLRKAMQAPAAARADFSSLMAFRAGAVTMKITVEDGHFSLQAGPPRFKQEEKCPTAHREKEYL